MALKQLVRNGVFAKLVVRRATVLQTTAEALTQLLPLLLVCQTNLIHENHRECDKKKF